MKDFNVFMYIFSDFIHGGLMDWILWPSDLIQPILYMGSDFTWPCWGRNGRFPTVVSIRVVIDWFSTVVSIRVVIDWFPTVISIRVVFGIFLD